MKTIDNFTLLSHLLHFNSTDEYYFLQIICRKKDNPTHSNNHKVIKTYYIYSLDYLEQIKPEVINLCKTFTARAYLQPSAKSATSTCIAIAQGAMNLLEKHQCFSFKNIIDSCAGSLKPIKSIYLVDIDDTNMRYINEVLSYIEKECLPEGLKFILNVPTVNGYHLLVKPFDVAKFNTQYPNIDVHKNNPTLLYFSDDK
jgi:hypothetical protein